MDDIAKTEIRIRKWLLATAIVFALIFAGLLIYTSQYTSDGNYGRR